MLGDFDRGDIDRVVASNVTGVLYGLNTAIRGMKEQGQGSVYNMEGLGSSGPIIKGLALYACTKAAVAYLTRAAAKEVEGSGVIVGGIRPGMVATKLITRQFEGRQEEWKQSERIFNIISDRVDTVAPWIAERILENKKNGAKIHWLTPGKMMGRFVTSRIKPRRIYEGGPQ